MKLYEIFSHLQSTYKSIEIDIVSVSHENKWINYLTLVRFTNEDPSVSNKQVSEDGRLQKLKGGNKFRIYKHYFPISSLSAIIENFEKGIKIIDGNTIHYDHPINLQNFNITFYRQHPDDIKFSAFRTFESANDTLRQIIYPLAELALSEIKPLGYEDIFDAIRRVFKIDYDGQSNSYVIVELPVFAKIEKVEIDRKQIRIVSRFHKKLTGLFITYGMKNFANRELESYDQSQGEIVEDGDFKIWELKVNSIPLDQSNDKIRCEVNLFFQPLAQDISYFSKEFGKMIAEKKLLDANPLAKIFSEFCKIEELQRIFTEAEVQRSKLTVSDYFERTVSWLFALHGFQSIWLGHDLQAMRSPKKINLGSADVICYNTSNKTLAAVSCKIGQIPDDAIDGIKNLSKTIEDEIKELQIEVVPIIVSAKPANAIKQKAKDHGVHIIDGNDLKIIVEKLYEGPPRPDLLLKPLTDTVTFRNFGIHYY